MFTNSSFDLNSNPEYFEMLRMIASLSRLFSEAKEPFIHYRVAENVFCKYYQADNLARTDTAFDARFKEQKLGVGIKTYVLPKGKNKSSFQKVAEFDALSPILRPLSGKKLALEIAKFRNERITKANKVYDITSSFYHIIGRTEDELLLFNTDYNAIDCNNIRVKKETEASLNFTDGIHEYSYSKSKSTLNRKFILEENIPIGVNILEDPFDFLELSISKFAEIQTELETRPYIILPLYSTRKPKNSEIINEKGKYVPLRSGLNQWNAHGRARDENEIYIPYPASVRNKYPDFMVYNPRRSDEDTEYYTLILPDGSEYEGKRCQENGKSLMTKSNKSLGKWLLRDILNIAPGKIVTIEDLDRAGFDSIIVYKNSDATYSIDICNSNMQNTEED